MSRASSKRKKRSAYALVQENAKNGNLMSTIDEEEQSGTSLNFSLLSGRRRALKSNQEEYFKRINERIAESDHFSAKIDSQNKKEGDWENDDYVANFDVPRIRIDLQADLGITFRKSAKPRPPYTTTLTDFHKFNYPYLQSRYCFSCWKFLPIGSNKVTCQYCPIIAHEGCIEDIDEFIVYEEPKQPHFHSEIQQDTTNQNIKNHLKSRINKKKPLLEYSYHNLEDDEISNPPNSDLISRMKYFQRKSNTNKLSNSRSNSGASPEKGGPGGIKDQLGAWAQSIQDTAKIDRNELALRAQALREFMKTTAESQMANSKEVLHHRRRSSVGKLVGLEGADVVTVSDQGSARGTDSEAAMAMAAALIENNDGVHKRENKTTSAVGAGGELQTDEQSISSSQQTPLMNRIPNLKHQKSLGTSDGGASVSSDGSGSSTTRSPLQNTGDNQNMDIKDDKSQGSKSILKVMSKSKSSSVISKETTSISSSMKSFKSSNSLGYQKPQQTSLQHPTNVSAQVDNGRGKAGKGLWAMDSSVSDETSVMSDLTTINEFGHSSAGDEAEEKKALYLQGKLRRRIEWICPFCLHELAARNDYYWEKYMKDMEYYLTMTAVIKIQTLMRMRPLRERWKKISLGVRRFQSAYKARFERRKMLMKRLGEARPFRIRVHDVMLSVVKHPQPETAKHYHHTHCLGQFAASKLTEFLDDHHNITPPTNQEEMVHLLRMGYPQLSYQLPMEVSQGYIVSPGTVILTATINTIPLPGKFDEIKQIYRVDMKLNEVEQLKPESLIKKPQTAQPVVAADRGDIGRRLSMHKIGNIEYSSSDLSVSSKSSAGSLSKSTPNLMTKVKDLSKRPVVSASRKESNRVMFPPSPTTATIGQSTNKLVHVSSQADMKVTAALPPIPPSTAIATTPAAGSAAGRPRSNSPLASNLTFLVQSAIDFDGPRSMSLPAIGSPGTNQKRPSYIVSTSPKHGSTPPPSSTTTTTLPHTMAQHSLHHGKSHGAHFEMPLPSPLLLHLGHGLYPLDHFMNPIHKFSLTGLAEAKLLGGRQNAKIHPFISHFITPKAYLMFPAPTANISITLTVSEVFDWPRALIVGQSKMEVDKFLVWKQVSTFTQELLEVDFEDIPMADIHSSKTALVVRDQLPKAQLATLDYADRPPSNPAAIQVGTPQNATSSSRSRTSIPQQSVGPTYAPLRIKGFQHGRILWSILPCPISGIQYGNLMFLSQPQMSASKKRNYCILIDRTMLVYGMTTDIKPREVIELKVCNVSVVDKEIIRIQKTKPPQQVWFIYFSNKNSLNEWLTHMQGGNSAASNNIA